MAKNQVHITLPPEVLAIVDAKVASLGFRNRGDYIVELIYDAARLPRALPPQQRLVRTKPINFLTKTYQFATTPEAAAYFKSIPSRGDRSRRLAEAVVAGLRRIIQNPELLHTRYRNTAKYKWGSHENLVSFKADGKLLTLADKVAVANGVSLRHLMGVAAYKGLDKDGKTGLTP